MCKYCTMCQANNDIAIKMPCVSDKIMQDEIKVQYPFISITIAENNGRGIRVRGLKAVFCPVCGTDLRKGMNE